MHTAKLLCHGVTIMERHIDHPHEAENAFGGIIGPGYTIVVEFAREHLPERLGKEG